MPMVEPVSSAKAKTKGQPRDCQKTQYSDLGGYDKRGALASIRLAQAEKEKLATSELRLTSRGRFQNVAPDGSGGVGSLLAPRRQLAAGFQRLVLSAWR